MSLSKNCVLPLKMASFLDARRSFTPPITALYPPGKIVMGVASRSLDMINIGRLAATIVTVPFAVVQSQAPSRREQRLYAFAYTVIKTVAAELAVAVRPVPRRGARPAAVRLAQEANTLIKSTYQTYDTLELREIMVAMGISPAHGAPIYSRASALRTVTVETARRLIARDERADGETARAINSYMSEDAPLSELPAEEGDDEVLPEAPGTEDLVDISSSDDDD